MTANFVEILRERGFFYQCTNQEELEALMARQSITGYLGFDATADSLHVGSLVAIMLLRWLQKTGHKPLVLIGGGTTRIGDPSGKDAARRMLSDDEIARNIKGIQSVLQTFLGTSATFVDNAQWLTNLRYIDFLRDFGQYFSVNRMLTAESVRLRLEREQNLSFLEFNYSILQAYDFYHLSKTYDCQLQMGGSDQWGNIVAGVDLVRRLHDKPVYGVTAPLITQADGSKMGKSVKGAIWLSADKLSPYDYWQFWRNTSDADVGRYLKLFTELSLDEIRRLEELQDAEINEAKKILADEATKLAHGAEVLSDIHKTVQGLFENKIGALESLPIISSQDLFIVNALVQGGLATSRGEARRLIRNRGVQLNDENVVDEFYKFQDSDFILDGKAKVTVGKKRHMLVKRES